MDFECYASCGFGIEGVLSHELKQLGMRDVRARDARVYFRGSEIDVARANVWARTADRIYIVLGEFEARTFDELYEQVSQLPFEEYLPKDAAFPVDGNAVQARLMSVSDIQSITKRAVVSALQRKYRLDRFPENGQRYHIFANNLKDIFTIALDTSGSGLSRRGYRLKNAVAPLKETLAAALLLIARWSRRDFFDPMCGSGTIAIEAALMATNTAPGLNRRFDAQTYNDTFAEAFSKVRQEARDAVHKPEMLIRGSDIDPTVLGLAREHAVNAGIAEYIEFENEGVSQFRQPAAPACVVSNPPYAVRLGDRDTVEELYRTMGSIFPQLDNTVAFFLCESDQFEKFYGIKADKKRKLYNGNMRCYYYQYFRRRR